jgi:D-aspartate ligase
MKRNTPAVVLGLSPTGLYAVRELGRAGVQVLGVARAWQPGCFSRHLVGYFVEPDELKRLERLMTHFPPDSPRAVLIPTSDQDIEFIARHAKRLLQRFVFQSSYMADAVQTLLTKERFYAMCEAEGVAYPRLWRCLPNELGGLRDRIAYPCMIKPSRIHDIKNLMAGQKGWIALDAADFDRLGALIPRGSGVLLLQEIVPGPESSITLHATYVDSTGAFRQPISARKLRQYPPGFGSASMVVSAQEDESRDIARRLLVAIGYRGIAAAEFKRDPRDGILKVIEINARPSLWFALATRAGQYMTLAAYHDLANTGQTLQERSQTDGVVWRYTFKDMYSALFYRLHKGFVLPPPDIRVEGTVSRRVNAVFAVDDPMPMLVELWHFARKGMTRLCCKAGLCKERQ